MLFPALLAHVVNQTLLAKERNRQLDIFEFITGAAGGKMAFLFNAETMRTLTMSMELRMNLQKSSWVKAVFI